MEKKEFCGLVADFIGTVGKTYKTLRMPDKSADNEIGLVLSKLSSVLAESDSNVNLNLPGEISLSDNPLVKEGKYALGRNSGRTDCLSDSISLLLDYAPWRYSYRPRSDIAGLENKIAFAELVGPDAPFISNDVCIGLTLIAPDTRYPEHYHPAVELYYVVSGCSLWTLDKRTVLRCPGEFILHESMAVHAMETAEEPLLAIYTWSGRDVKTTSAYV